MAFAIDKKQAFQFLAVFVGSYLVYKFTFPKSRKNFKAGAIEMKEQSPQDREYINPPTMDESQVGLNPLSDNAFKSLKAYVAAYNAQEPQSALDELNVEINKDYGLKVIRRRTDNKLAVYDTQDQEVMVYNG